MEKKNLDNLIKESFESNEELRESNVEVTPLMEIRKKIKKKRNRKIANYLVKPAIFVFAFIVIAFLAIMLTDSPGVNALKFKLFKIHYNIKDGKVTYTTEERYKILKNDDNNLKIEFYDFVIAQDMVEGEFYYPKYIPDEYELDNVTWFTNGRNYSTLDIKYKHPNNENINVYIVIPDGEYKVTGTTYGELKNVVVIEGNDGLLYYNKVGKNYTLEFFVENKHFRIHGVKKEEDIIKIAESIFDE